MRNFLLRLVLLAVGLYVMYCLYIIREIYRGSGIPEDPADPRRRFWYVHVFFYFTVQLPLSSLFDIFAGLTFKLAKQFQHISDWIEG